MRTALNGAVEECAEAASVFQSAAYFKTPKVQLNIYIYDTFYLTLIMYT